MQVADLSTITYHKSDSYTFIEEIIVAANLYLSVT